jgi:membrane protease YdiL (CAAX protease family)
MSASMPRARRLFPAAAFLVATVCIAVGLAYANGVYFDLANRLVAAREPLSRGLLYSSWLMLLALPFAVVRPTWLKLDPRGLRSHVTLVAGFAIVAVLITAGLLKLMGPTPFSDASLVIEVGVVPVTEELVFRGVMLSALLGLTSAAYSGRSGIALAVLVDGIAFGVAHVANAGFLQISFVFAQAAFASVLGVALAALVARTNCVWAAVLVHAAVNATVVLL